MKAWKVVCAGLALARAAPRSAAGEAKAHPPALKGGPPRLVGSGDGARLEVGGAPFLVLGGGHLLVDGGFLASGVNQ
jgi:hypothetical protein